MYYPYVAVIVPPLKVVQVGGARRKVDVSMVKVIIIFKIEMESEIQVPDSLARPKFVRKIAVKQRQFNFEATAQA